jgi:hypothetical protein
MLMSRPAPSPAERGHFELVEARKGERAPLTSLGIELDVDAVYADPLAAQA